MKRGPKAYWRLLMQTFSDWYNDKAPELGAALAFYTALSIAPLLVIVLSVAALVFGQEAASGQILSQMREMVGEDGAKAISDMIQSANKPTQGTIATVLSVVTLLFGASGVFGQLQTSLNTIWRVQPKPGRGVWGMVRDRFASFAMVLGVAFLLLVSLIISAVLSAMGALLNQLPDSLHWIAQGLNAGVSFLVVTLLFAMIFRILPDVRIAWRDVWLGAIVTAVLFVVGKTAIGLYIGHSAMASSYGVAGSFVVLLVWVYYSAQILYFGAEVTKVYANHFGSKIVPAENAIPLTTPAAPGTSPGAGQASQRPMGRRAHRSTRPLIGF
jgi:membrane protein